MDDGYLLKIRNLLLFWLITFGAVILGLFVPEMRESMRDGTRWVAGDVAEEVLPARYIPGSGDFVLRPETNDVERLAVSATKVESFDGAKVSLAFEMRNLGGDNAHPSLRLVVMRQEKSVSRTVTLRPHEYPHIAGPLKVEVIRLSLPVKPGEASVRVEPFYDQAAKK